MVEVDEEGEERPFLPPPVDDVDDAGDAAWLYTIARGSMTVAELAVSRRSRL